MTLQCKENFGYTKEPLIGRLDPVTVVKQKPKSKERPKKTIKCVIVGDRKIGKTSLAVSYSNDKFPSEYTPTVYDNYKVVVEVDGKKIRYDICDTAGEDGPIPIDLCYDGTDVFMLCFSVVNRESFISACTKWKSKLQQLRAAVVLVGTQADLKYSQSNKQNMVSWNEAADLAAELNAQYVETSAKTCYHLKEAFDEAIIAALAKRKNRWRRLCCY
ncbi:cdc42 homolog isoform X2 [Aethina tumida]|uniref:cdc42 homolog isoform X2 n=1 Tax=Aethina tumida TaxID=116153 RepID=UPI00096AF19B|nr:cdc42 homolog isoform X2 [Aethina tumida]